MLYNPLETERNLYFYDEKLHLINTLENIETNLKENEYKELNDVFKLYLKKEIITKRRIKDNIKEGILYFMFYVLSPIFVIINLIGIFQSKIIMTSLFEVLKNSALYYFKNNSNYINDTNIGDNDSNRTNNETYYFNYNETYNFYNLYYKSSLDKSINFDLMMIMDFIGCIFLKSLGFRITSLIFLLLNSISFFLIYNFKFDSFDHETSKYSLSKIFYLILCYILLFIGVGASSLLSQKILIDSFSKLTSYLNNSNPVGGGIIDNDSNSFKIELQEKNKIGKIEIKKDENLDNQIRDDSNDSNEQENKFGTFFMICLTTIIGFFGRYYLNVIFKNKEKIEYFLYSYGVYLISILFSLILYTIFECVFTKNQKENSEKRTNQYTIYQICGYTIYIEKKILKKDIQKCECFKLCCNTLNNCCLHSLCTTCIDKEGICCCLCCIFRLCCDCECLDERPCECCYCDDVDFGQNDSFFCYCFQAKRKYYWLNNYLTNDFQRKILSKLYRYFLLQLITMGFEAKFNENNKNGLSFIDKENNLIMGLIFILSFILFFSITISLGRMVRIFKEDDSNQKEYVSKLSNEMVEGINGILIFNSIYSLVFSFIYFSQKDIFDKNYYIYIPVLFSKFFYLIITFYSLCLSEEAKGFELISGSTLVSLYLLLWNILLSYLMKINFSALFILQIVFSMIIVFIIAVFTLVSLACCGFLFFCKMFFLLFIMIFCFGGLFIRVKENEDDEYCCGCICQRGCDFYCMCCNHKIDCYDDD